MEVRIKMFCSQLGKVNKFTIFRTYATKDKPFKSAKAIRQEFIKYFVNDLNHTLIRSSPVYPLNDPSISFVNAGMNQFKGVFLGEHSPPALKIANSSKCIRVGGKHNDLDMVGQDTYHHTFFEMLGNWSFGDYFKQEACKYAWTLLTEGYGIKKEHLYVTYFNGHEKLNLKPDLECKDIWLSLGVPQDRVLPFGIDSNFWEMGPIGPCGPCTEIHIDHTMSSTNQADRVNKGHADLVELWNIVFIQYQRNLDGQILPLRTKHVDTGMGLERLVAFLQGKRSNYSTDLFQPLFDAIEKIANAPKYQGRFALADRDNVDTAYRILADHARMISVALADGILPDQNQKLRRVLRKAIYLSENTFRSNNLLVELTNYVADSLGDVYPELHTNLKKIQHVIRYEEEVLKSSRDVAHRNWKKIVDTRPELSRLSDIESPGLIAGYNELQSLLHSGSKIESISGKLAYKMYDTYGLNADAISKLAEVESLTFDMSDFLQEFEKMKEECRIRASISNKDIISKSSLDILESKKIPKTDDSFKYAYIHNDDGYHFPMIKSKLVAMVVNGNLISEPQEMLSVDESQAVVEATVTHGGNIVEINSVIDANTEVGLILDKTMCFSPEGGQVSDKGQIQIKNLVFNFDRVRKVRDYVVHIGHFVVWDAENPELQVSVDDECTVSVDNKYRAAVMRNHTGTHLLHAALQQIIPVVGQRGSNVSNEGLTFECSVFGQKLTLQDIAAIEKTINDCIQANVPVKIKTVNLSEMLSESNVTVIPGEHYPDTGIRIVEINNGDFISKEACCGTHVHMTGTIEHFCITNMKSQGTASKKFTAITGTAARLAQLAGENVQNRIMNLEIDFKQNNNGPFHVLQTKIASERRQLVDKNQRLVLPYLTVQECLARIDKLLKDVKIKEKSLSKNSIEEEFNKFLNISTLPFVVHCLQPNNVALNNLALPNIIKLCPPKTPVLVILYSQNKVKAQCYVPKELQSVLFNAQSWMKTVLSVFVGKGIGIKGEDTQTTFTMMPMKLAGKHHQAKIEQAIAEATKFAAAHVNKSETNNTNK